MAKLFAFFGMICWGIAPIFGKIGLKNIDSVTALIIRTLIAGSMVSAWVFLVPVSNNIDKVSTRILFFIAAEAILATLIGDLSYFVAIRRGNINDVTLIMSCSPLITMVLSYFFLSEKVNSHHIFGGVLIISGLILIGIEPKY